MGQVVAQGSQAQTLGDTSIKQQTAVLVFLANDSKKV